MTDAPRFNPNLRWSMPSDGRLTSEAQRILRGLLDRMFVDIVIGDTVQAYDALLAAIAALTTSAGGFIRTSGSNTVVAQAIVGTVSQSGGNPTGALFEVGSNANGDYLRFPDGTQLCWHILSFGAGNNAGAGTLADMYRSAVTAWTLPAAFVDSSYSVFGLARMIGTGAAGFSVLGGPAAADKSTTAVSNMQIYRGTNSATDVSAYLLAIGQWV